MVAPSQAGSTDLAPQFLKFARQAIACAARVSLVAAGRGEAVRHILSGTRDRVSLPVGGHEPGTQLGVLCLPDPASGTPAAEQQREQPRPAGPMRCKGRAGHLPAVIRLAQPAIGVLLLGLELLSKSYRGFEVSVRLRAIPRCDREPGDGV